MKKNSKALDELVYSLCQEDDKLYEEIARGMVEFTSYCKYMNELLYSGFEGKTFEEFEKWREERAKNYRMVANAYEKLPFLGDSWRK